MAAITRTVRGLVCELELTATDVGVPTDCIVNFDNIHIIPREAFRRHVVTLEPPRLAQVCQRQRGIVASLPSVTDRHLSQAGFGVPSM